MNGSIGRQPSAVRLEHHHMTIVFEGLPGWPAGRRMTG